MRRHSPWMIPLLALLLAVPAGAQRLDVKEHRLANGMQLLLVEDHTLPVMTYFVFFHVGSRNEVQGITGISHLFEHMMFNGAKKYGPEMFDRTLEGNGGYSNAFTGRDMTAYYEDFPSSALETVLDLEQDRMRDLNLTQASMDHELGVVREERRFRVDNTTEGPCEEQLWATAFNAHSYHWDVIGWMADLDSMKVQSCREYFHTYYAPNNCTVVLSGDFDSQKVLPLVEKYLGVLKASDPPKRIPTPEPEQMGERRAEIRKEGEVPLVYVGYKGPSATDPDMPALDVLEYIVARGESSRLYRSLVAGSQTCLDAGANFEWMKDPGLLVLTATVKPDKAPADVEKLLYAQLDTLARIPVAARELEAAKNGLEAHLVRELKTTEGRALVLGNYQLMLGDWKLVNTMMDRYRAVTAADVQRVAARYFNPLRRTVVTFIPTETAAAPAR
ncbi:MAG: insulinase family protein [Candidatus Eisenbacteria bacterium]|nr:insulinase family protein [Candidatus Eisenbacteria bacterium]